VIGVALFGSLIGGTQSFMPGLREALIIATVLLLSATGAMIVCHRDERHMNWRQIR
jgi:hypothetical protein